MIPNTSAVYGRAAQAYWHLGWQAPLPIPTGQKAPPPDGYTGWDGIDPSYADIHAWIEDKPNGNIAIRMPEGVIGIDVDNYGTKFGGLTITEAESRWGALPYSPRSTSRADDRISGIRFYRVPAGLTFVNKLTFPELGYGDVEIIQRHHRYAVCWPSINPLTGLVYQWVDDDGRPVEPPRPLALPELQAPWINGLYEAHRASGAASLDSGEMAALMTDGEPEGRVLHFVTRAIEHLDTGVGSRFDNTRDTVLALLRCGLDGDLGVRDAIDTLREEYVLAVTSDGSRTDAVARSEFERMITNPRAALLLSEPSHADLFSAFPQP